MKRQTEREQMHRLSVKTLDQVFIARLRGTGLLDVRVSGTHRTHQGSVFSLAHPAGSDPGGVAGNGGGLSR
jgi:hypothetical protein